MDFNLILKNIRTKGGRITKFRKELIKILTGTKCLISQAEISAQFKKLKMKPNRSTIFRELLFFTKNNIAIKNTISGVDYYEIPHDHHHHLVCLNCNSIEKVEIRDHLEKQEKQIAKQSKFNILHHSLEFYGYCRHCGNRL